MFLPPLWAKALSFLADFQEALKAAERAGGEGEVLQRARQLHHQLAAVEAVSAELSAVCPPGTQSQDTSSYKTPGVVC